MNKDIDAADIASLIPGEQRQWDTNDVTGTS